MPAAMAAVSTVPSAERGTLSPMMIAPPRCSRSMVAACEAKSVPVKNGIITCPAFCSTLIAATAARAESSSCCCGPQPSWRSPGAGVAATDECGASEAPGSDRMAPPDGDAVAGDVPDDAPEGDGEGTPVQAAVASMAAVMARASADLRKVFVSGVFSYGVFLWELSLRP
ncbi:hypothetical protein D9M72_442650 [compost metagenome]